MVRRPKAVRPWQHILEPLAGYLLLAERLWQREMPVSPSYNFGPYDFDVRPVSAVVETLVGLWGSGCWKIQTDDLHEAGLLILDSTLARAELGWKPRLALEGALELVVNWCNVYRSGGSMDRTIFEQIDHYETAGEDERRVNPCNADAQREFHAAV